MIRLYPALVLNDYLDAPYAEWVKTGKKTIETRMGRLFRYRGDIVICCGYTNSVGPNRGNAICMVEVYDGGKMEKEHERAACIEWHPDRKILMLRNLRYFSRDFKFSSQAVKKNFQGVFSILIPEDVQIIKQWELFE